MEQQQLEFQLRAAAMDFALKANTEGDVIELAERILNFLKGVK